MNGLVHDMQMAFLFCDDGEITLKESKQNKIRPGLP